VNAIDTGVWHTKTYNCPFNRIKQNNLHSATRLKRFQKEIPQTLAFIMADCDSRNETMSNQTFWQKNFGELPLIHQIRQSFLPPKFSSVWYMVSKQARYWFAKRYQSSCVLTTTLYTNKDLLVLPYMGMFCYHEITVTPEQLQYIVNISSATKIIM